MNAFGANLEFNTEVVCKSNLIGGQPAPSRLRTGTNQAWPNPTCGVLEVAV